MTQNLNMCMLMVLFFVFFGARQISAEDVEDVPTWPTAYIARGVLKTPCAEISEPFDAWYDNAAGSSRVDYYNGTVKTYQLSKDGKYGTYYKLEPVLTKIACFKTEGTPERKVQPQSILPDMTGYKLIGEATINGKKTEQWEMQSQSNTVYTMYLYWKKKASTKVIVPVRFEQQGADRRYMDFDSFAAVSPPADTFKIQNVDSCKPLTEAYFDGLTRQVVYSFTPIQEYVDNNTDHVDVSWQNYKQAFNKKYDEAEDSQRKNIFRRKMTFITSTNRANLSYTLGLNHLTDYTDEEMNALTSCINNHGHFHPGAFQDFDNDTALDFEAPASWNWQDLGAVTPVRDQGSCGSCWAFSATGAMEGAYFIKTKRLVKLSEQVLMDCTWDYGNKGCDGGYMSNCFNWVIKNNGLPLERAYGRYRERPNFCRKEKTSRGVRIRQYKHIKPYCTKCIKQHLVKYGPITVGVYANKAFHAYQRGVFIDSSCPKGKMNHAVLIIGYGELQGREYWRVKNSWGYRWGDAGYILMDMNSNTCGVMDDPICVVI